MGGLDFVIVGVCGYYWLYLCVGIDDEVDYYWVVVDCLCLVDDVDDVFFLFVL